MWLSILLNTVQQIKQMQGLPKPYVFILVIKSKMVWLYHICSLVSSVDHLCFPMRCFLCLPKNVNCHVRDMGSLFEFSHYMALILLYLCRQIFPSLYCLFQSFLFRSIHTNFLYNFPSYLVLHRLQTYYCLGSNLEFPPSLSLL